MSESKQSWEALPPHSYERYVAWLESCGIYQVPCENNWYTTAISMWLAETHEALVTPKHAYDEWLASKAPSQFQTADKPPLTNSAIRAELLDTVKSYVCKDRSTAHGDAEDNFKHIAWLWSDYLAMIKPREKLTNKDVAAMMVLFKVARAAHNPDNLDNWLDAAGYSICGGSIAKVEQLRNEGTK